MILLPSETLHLEPVEGGRSVNVVTASGMHAVCNLSFTAPAPLHAEETKWIIAQFYLKQNAEREAENGSDKHWGAACPGHAEEGGSVGCTH